MAGKHRTPKKEKRRGPKSKYNPDVHNKLVEGLAEVGFTDAQMAKKLKIARSTLSLWKKEYPDFAKILQRGKDEYDTTEVEGALNKRAIGFTHKGKYYPPEVVAIIFWLKNRQPERWRDRKDIAIGGTVKLILEDE